MAQQVAEALPADTVLPELRPSMQDALIPFLDCPDATRSVERSFLALRNRLAHGGGISRRLAADLLAHWQGPFEALWQHLPWLADGPLPTPAVLPHVPLGAHQFAGKAIRGSLRTTCETRASWS
jgi:hypothetical protein